MVRSAFWACARHPATAKRSGKLRQSTGSPLRNLDQRKKIETINGAEKCGDEPVQISMLDIRLAAADD
jgi:hypothetical protein